MSTTITHTKDAALPRFQAFQAGDRARAKRRTLRFASPERQPAARRAPEPCPLNQAELRRLIIDTIG